LSGWLDVSASPMEIWDFSGNFKAEGSIIQVGQ